MTRTILLALLLSSCAAQPPTATVIDGPTKARIVRYAIAAHENGTPPAQIVNRIVTRTDADRDEVIALLKRVRGRLNREPDSLRVERVGVIAANADAAAVNAVIADGYCYPLNDEGDAAGYTACLAREADSLTERFCRITNGADVARGARFAVTADQRAHMLAAINALPEAPRIEKVRNADDGTAYLDAATAKGVQRCAEVSP